MTRTLPTGQRIRERRLALGRKQAQVAVAAGISASYLNLIEHNRRAIGGALLSRLAEVLETDRAALSEEGSSELVDALRVAGADAGIDAAALETASDMVIRHPAWAELIAAQAAALASQARTLEALSDRLSHDPGLAEAMHELLSTVSVVRSTAAILAQTPEIDPNWLGRFHANLDADSRRLADGAEAVMDIFASRAAPGGENLLPAEIVSKFLDDKGHRFDELEEEGASAVPGLVAEITNPSARALAQDMLGGDAADAARLPRTLVEAAEGPDDLIAAAGGDLALALRRLGVVDPMRGLVICDASGALLRRKAVAGFSLPVMGAGCPLWPLYTALGQPGRPLTALLETPDGAGWQVHAVAAPLVPPGFGQAPVLRSTMLITRASKAGAGEPVGPGCRICPRQNCIARREPSVQTFDSRLDSHRPDVDGQA